MSRFTYSAVMSSGQRVSGLMRCQDRHQAISQLVGRGLHPVAVEPAEDGKWTLGRLRKEVFNRVGTAALAVFTRQLASLLKAGLPMMRALETLRQQCENRRLAEVTEDLAATLSREGSTLADALENHPRIFTPVFRSLVRAGEEGGHLVEVLNDLARYLGQSARLRGQVIGAFIYPSFLTLLGAMAVFVLMTFVIPRFQELFQGLGQNLPRPTQMLIAASDFLSAWWPAVLGVVGTVPLLAFLALRKARSRRAIDWLMLRCPVLGKMFLKLELARISRALAALLAGGVRIIPALRIVGATARNAVVRASFEPITQRVAAGESLGEAMARTGVYPPLLLNLVRTGEEAGELPEMLGELSTVYEEQAEAAVTSAVRLLEPLLIVSMGLIIAGIISAVMLPIFQAQSLVE